MLKFSIVIPAHNENKYIEKTLAHVRDLNYPKDSYEGIVIENGSSDDTFALAKQFESETIRVLQSDKGVSKAKNVGIDNLLPHTDWVIFLDADTILEKEFLNELNVFLSRPNNFSVGTVSVQPNPETLKARLWFRFYDLGHIVTHASYSIKIVKRSLFPPLRFDEALVMSEDIHVIREAQQFGRFFFMWTKSVSTSIRRFEQLGWWRTFFYWIFVPILPERFHSRFGYEIVR